MLSCHLSLGLSCKWDWMGTDGLFLTGVPGLHQAVAAGDFLPGLSGIGQFLPVFLSIPIKVISKHIKK